MKIGVVVLCVFVVTLLPKSRAIDPGTVAKIAKYAMPFIKNVVQPFLETIFGFIFGDNKWTDDILAGRSVRITKIGETGCNVADKGTGISISMSDGQFPNMEEAVSTACEELVVKLMEMGIVTPENLGIPVPTTTTKKPCYNTMNRKMCDNYNAKGYCDRGSSFWQFMNDNCYETCGCDKPTAEDQATSTAALLEQLYKLKNG